MIVCKWESLLTQDSLSDFSCLSREVDMKSKPISIRRVLRKTLVFLKLILALLALIKEILELICK